VTRFPGVLGQRGVREATAQPWGEASDSFLRKLRAALPPDVAIWSEFPVGDVTSQYLDGNITYYCLYWNEYFGAWHDGDGRAPRQAPLPRDLYRYALPQVRQFIFLCGSEDWTSDQKFPFFNGEPLYDISWFLYAGPHLTDMRRALRLQTEYADCFSSSQPVPEVPTEVGGVYANAFPGRGRTIWTLYNANYATVRGTVLAVPHRPGAVYRDLWHDRVLQPEIKAGRALLKLALHPQEVGCVAQQ
jgi:hypothetical protein